MVKLEKATKARIVGVAERMFLSSGFSRVSMDDLAKELGMSKKTLYAHFTGKEVLVRAILEHRTAAIEEKLQEIVESATPFAEKFRDLAQLLQAKIGEVSPAFLEDIRRFSPEGYGVIERFRARAIPRYFGRIIDDGIRAGYLEDTVPRELLIRMVLLSIQGIVRPDVVAELKLHPSVVLDHILTIIFSGILTAKGRRARKQLQS